MRGDNETNPKARVATLSSRQIIELAEESNVLFCLIAPRGPGEPGKIQNDASSRLGILSRTLCF